MAGRPFVAECVRVEVAPCKKWESLKTGDPPKWLRLSLEFPFKVAKTSGMIQSEKQHLFAQGPPKRARLHFKERDTTFLGLKRCCKGPGRYYDTNTPKKKLTCSRFLE